MQPLQPVHGEPRPGLAIGGGILAGLATLALIAFGLWLAGRSDNPTDTVGRPGFGQPIAASATLTGDCVDLATGPTGRPAGFILADCADSHKAQVTARIEHPDGDGPFPGGADLVGWIDEQCQSPTDDFIGGPILETTLEGDWLLPDLDDWEAGDTGATCYVTNFDGSLLTASVEGRADEHKRGEEVQVSRLIVGDCFVPSGGAGAYELNSNSAVTLTSCEGGHNGVFFGRDRLDYSPDADFPGNDTVGEVTSDRCADLFRAAFDTDSDGFNYRYWRPNEQSWDLGDRSILCAVLDVEPLDEEFDPGSYERFFDVETGTCFNLGPEESSTTLRLDDQVRVLDCDEPHVGQMVGRGELPSAPDDPFPGEEIKEQASEECRVLFGEFMGVSPFASTFGKFPFWYPNLDGWEAGDRRYACAIVEPEPRSGSLQGAEI